MFRLLCLPLAAALWAGQAAAEVPVDVELVLAVDVSRSISPTELEIQRQGYAEALASPEVMDAIAGGFEGRIALTYVEWASRDYQRQVIGWTLVATPEEAAQFGRAIVDHPPRTVPRTSLSAALLFAGGLFEDNGFSSWRQVVDISGDGPNNDGPDVTRARDALVARGIVINGLPILGSGGDARRFHPVGELDRYYESCVVGGPGAFVLPVTEWSSFAAAVRRKLVLEIAGRPATLHHASFETPAAYDCRIGEKLWDRSRPR